MTALVTLQLAKDYLKISGTDSDTVLETLIEAATRRTEDYCNSAWVKREITETHIGDGKNRLYLYRQPVTEVDSVTIDGEEYTDYTERLSIGMLWGSWTNLTEIVVTYAAGYLNDITEALTTIPDAVAAVLMTVAAWYNNPEGLDSQNISGIGSVSFGGELELPDRAKAKLTALRKSLL